MTAFDVSERRLRDGRAESCARTAALLCAHTVPALRTAAGLGDVRSEALAWEHRADPEHWWAGPAAGVGTVGGLVSSRGPEGVAAVKREYDVMCREFATAGGELALPHVAVPARGTA